MKAKAQGLGVCAGIIKAGFAVAAVALVTPLDPDFLNYLEKFGDAQGEVFDARELAEMPVTESAPAATKSSAAHSVSSPVPSSVSRETSP